MKNTKDYNGIALALSEVGLIIYRYNDKEISIEEFVEIEQIAYEDIMKNKYRLFKVYRTNSIVYIAYGLN